MKMINHELFGKLEYKNNIWRGKITITMFNLEKEILLTVDAHESADFSNVQRQAFIIFLQGMKDLINEVEQQVYDDYNESYEKYRDMLGNESEADKVASKIDSILDLKRLVNPTEFIVRRVRKNDKRRLGLLCDVSWDIENGLGIKIEDEIVEEVGYQDIVL